MRINTQTMEKHQCKLCLKIFTNGNALGGHMRSHMLPHSSPPSPPSSSSENEADWSRKVTKHTFRRRRSKRIRRPEEQSSVSSISNTSPEEHVAFCLMMLSRDTWSDMEDIESKSSTRSEFRCETCDKVFKSYQALGGHKASHKKMKLNQGDNDHKTKIVLSENNKVHECDVCFKVFGSGQALGGHKRSHVNVGKHKINLIDLNLPAPIDEDDDDGGSQFEASVVSDGEFVN